MLFESSSTSSTCTSTEEDRRSVESCWNWCGFVCDSREHSRWSALAKAGLCTARWTLVKAPSQKNLPKAKHMQACFVMQAIISLESWLFFLLPSRQHTNCVSSPVKKRGREEHTAWDATLSCPCLSSLVKVKIKSDNGQTTPNKTDRHRALAEWQKAYTVSIARTLMLPGLYVTPPVTFRPSIGLITRYSERGHSECVPRAFDTARVPEEKCIFTI